MAALRADRPRLLGGHFRRILPRPEIFSGRGRLWRHPGLQAPVHGAGHFFRPSYLQRYRHVSIQILPEPGPGSGSRDARDARQDPAGPVDREHDRQLLDGDHLQPAGLSLLRHRLSSRTFLLCDGGDRAAAPLHDRFGRERRGRDSHCPDPARRSHSDGVRLPGAGAVRDPGGRLPDDAAGAAHQPGQLCLRPVVFEIDGDARRAVAADDMDL